MTTPAPPSRPLGYAELTTGVRRIGRSGTPSWPVSHHDDRDGASAYVSGGLGVREWRFRPTGVVIMGDRTGHHGETVRLGVGNVRLAVQTVRLGVGNVRLAVQTVRLVG